MSRKLLLEDVHGQREFLLVGTLTVGRDPRCEISANDPLLSRQHAEFVETASGVLVRDLHSQNGIRVNDIAVKEAALRSGDIVQIARMNLRFIEDVSAQPAAVPGAAGDDDKTSILKAPAAFTPRANPAQDAVSAPDSASVPVSAPAPLPAQAPGATPAASAASNAALPATPVGAAPATPAATPSGTAPATGAATPVAGSSASATPSPVAGGPSAVSGPPPIDDGDRTRVVQMPSAAARAARSGAAKTPAASAAPSAPASPASSSPAAASSSSSSAPVAPAPAASPVVPAASPASAGPASSRGATASPAAAPAAPDAATPAKSAVRTPRGTWGGRVLLRILLLGLVCSLASAVPLMFWHQQQVSAVAESRATTLANWFAAEATLALERGQDAGPAVDLLSREAGVIAARVVTPEGHVIAPASRAAEVVSTFPGIGAAPADVLRQQSGWNGGVLEIVQPVATSRGPRTALAWLTVNPTTEFGGSSLVIVAPAVVGAIFFAWIVAMLITRPTLRALGQLNEDVELALSGRLDEVRDPLGAKPVKELTDTISYLAARLRTSGLDVGLERGRRGPFLVGGQTGQRAAVSSDAGSTAGASSHTPGNAGGGAGAAAPSSASASASPHPAGAAQPPVGSQSAPSTGTGPARATDPARAASGAASASAPVSSSTAQTGQLMVDTAFRVTHADPACAALLATRVDALVGRHLLDAITDRHIVDAVLGCLSALPASGEREASATDAAGRTIAVVVGRPGKDQPVTVTLRATEARSS